MEMAKRPLAFLLVAVVVTIAVLLSVGGKASGSATHRAASASPSAVQFAVDLARATNEAPVGTGRVRNVNCVQAAPNEYMCSYTVETRGASTCHLMQGRWTPDSSSAITVTLAGRTRRCGTLKEAIATLK